MKFLLLAALSALYAQAQLTTIVGTLYLPDGSKYSGNIACTWPTPFVGGDGRIMPAGPQVSASVKNGALSINLEANSTATPSGTSYVCIYRPTGAGSIAETWSVTYSPTPIPLTAVRVPNPPIPISSLLPGNPSAVIGLSAVDGSAVTYMRSDSAPALSQAIAPTWTGVHTFNLSAGGIKTIGAPSIVESYAGQNVRFGGAVSFAAASATAPEAALFLQMTSTLGVGDPLGAYKADLLSNAVCGAGSADCWNTVNLFNISPGGAKRHGVALELDFNNGWGNYTGSPAYPLAAAILITGTNAGGYGSCAICLDFGGAGPLWNYGIHFGLPGASQFNTAAISDETNSPISYQMRGAHTNGLDMSEAIFSGYEILAPGFSVTATGALSAATVLNTPTSSNPGCTLAGHLGKQWMDSTSSVTTHFKVCANVASTPAWVQVF